MAKTLHLFSIHWRSGSRTLLTPLQGAAVRVRLTRRRQAFCLEWFAWAPDRSVVVYPAGIVITGAPCLPSVSVRVKRNMIKEKSRLEAKSLIMFLFTLTETESRQGAPVITIPAG